MMKDQKLFNNLMKEGKEAGKKEYLIKHRYFHCLEVERLCTEALNLMDSERLNQFLNGINIDELKLSFRYHDYNKFYKFSTLDHGILAANYLNDTEITKNETILKAVELHSRKDLFNISEIHDLIVDCDILSKMDKGYSRNYIYFHITELGIPKEEAINYLQNKIQKYEPRLLEMKKIKELQMKEFIENLKNLNF